MIRHLPLLVLLALGSASPVAGQMALPSLGGVVREPLDTVQRALDPTLDGVTRVGRDAQALVRERLRRMTRLVRESGGAVQLDSHGDPARAGELLLLEPSAEALALAQLDGFGVLSDEKLDALDIRVVRLQVPGAMSLAKGEARLRKLLPDAEISADTLLFQAGAVASPARRADGPALPPDRIKTPVGLIDGAAGAAISTAGTRGFARGAPLPSDHGSAIASLLQRGGIEKIWVADVYGADPAGGNAFAIARGLDWLASVGARVISISLVGPDNPLLRRAVNAARARGLTVVAAVGNDGPAAPPAYPASYAGVIAVTGVDHRNRALIEAGRALHLDYAAPGAGFMVATAAGKRKAARGTSYAVPFVVLRAASAIEGQQDVVRRLDAEARDLGPAGPDRLYGRGLVCGRCAR